MISFPHFKTNYWVAHFEEKKSMKNTRGFNVPLCRQVVIKQNTYTPFFFQLNITNHLIK